MEYIIKECKNEDISYIKKEFSFFNQKHLKEEPSKPFMILALNEGEVIGGIDGYCIWGWKFIDNWFVVEEKRNQGIGMKLLNNIIQKAKDDNIQNISINTIYDQVEAPLIRKGFYTDGVLVDRPLGFKYRFMRGNSNFLKIKEKEREQHFLSDNEISDKQKEDYYQMIQKDKEKNVGQIPFEWVNLKAETTGKCLGGLLGYIGWNWLYISVLWVDDEERGKGIGKALMMEAEKIALSKGIKHAFLGTTDFQAPIFYQKLGYQVFSTRKDLPKGFNNYSMKKDLGK